MKQPNFHRRQKMLSAHLSTELRKGLKRRSVTLRKGDKVMVMRGSPKGTIGKIESLDLKKTRVEIEGLEITKVDGTKVKRKLSPSVLLVVELNLDERRRKKLEAD